MILDNILTLFLCREKDSGIIRRERKRNIHSSTMDIVDTASLFEYIQVGQGEERDMQSYGLEQLCMLLLMADNVDRVFEK